jgi:hypothetical protein
VQLPYVVFANLDFPTTAILPSRGPMKRLDLDYWYSLGRAVTMLELSFQFVPCDVDSRAWSRINMAIGWLEPIAHGELAVIPGTQRAAADIVETVGPLLETHKGNQARIDPKVQNKLHVQIATFHNILRSGAQEIYVYLLEGSGAYSARALIERASSHLSSRAQQVLPESERKDYDLAGAAYACELPTACGFHAMRAIEAEARRYHMLVTGRPDQVDWTLDPLINGNSGRSQFGLRDQWKKEGTRDDSPLLMIITLLKSITQIYRNPIMHPEMTLGIDQAKQVFDTAALLISAMVEDRVNRQKAALPPAIP